MTGAAAGPAPLPTPLGALPTPSISDDARALHAGVRDFVQRRVLPAMPRLEQPDFGLLTELVREAGAAGIPGASIGAEHGGLGLDLSDALRVAHALGGAPSFAVTIGAHAGLAGGALSLGGSPAQRARWLPGVADASTLGCYGLTEPDAGSDALALRTVAERDGGDWLISGSKQFITNAGFADLAVVFALAEGTAFSGFVIPMDAPGVTLGPEERKLGLHGSSTRALHLDRVRVPDGHLLGQAGRGHRTAFAVLTLGRLRLAAGALGETRHLLDLVRQHCAERHQFGQPLSSFGITRRKVAELTAELLAAEAMLWRTTARLDAVIAEIPPQARDRRLPMRITGFDVEAALCKVVASELLGRAADEAVQLFGGYGYMEEAPVARAFRDARVQRIFEGTNEICRLLVAPGLLRRIRDGVGPGDDDTWEQSVAHALTGASLTALTIARDHDDLPQPLAEVIADTVADAVSVSALDGSRSEFHRLARIVVARSALERSFIRLSRITPVASLDRLHALLANAPDAMEHAEELGRRVLDGETLEL